jgi:S-layer family protein
MKKLLIPLLALAAVGSGVAVGTLQSNCGPFADVSPGFCPFVLELYYLGITAGTSPTTFSPGQPITRGQAAVFVSRAIDISIQRSSPRAALDQWWATTPQYANGLGTTAVGDDPAFAQSDGADLWVANNALGGSGSVSRVRASDGKLLETWTGADTAFGALVAMGRIFVTGIGSGKLYMIDPSQPVGAVTTVADLAPFPTGLTFDGMKIWTANSSGSVSIVTPSASLPWAVTTVTAGFSIPVGAVFDGSHVWVTDRGTGTLLKLSSSGAILQTVTVGAGANQPIFDGVNIWVPNQNDNTVSVVSAATGTVIGTLTGNGLNGPGSAAFDGERVLITNFTGSSVSLWKAATLSPLGNVSTGSGSEPTFACSDGLNFWIVLYGPHQLARF